MKSDQFTEPKTEDKVANVNDGDGWRWYEPKLDEKCWDTHKQVGMKNKNGKKVPNCIPKESSILSGINKLSEEKIDTKQVNENLNDGISQEELANSLEYRLMRMYPDIVNKYGHEVVADAIMDTASFYAGATELGTSDVSIMVKGILRNLESRSNLVDNVYEDSYRDMTDEIKKEIIKSQKMRNATRLYYYNWLLSVPVRAATSYEKFINSYAGENWFNRHEPQIKSFADEQNTRFQKNYKIEYPQTLDEAFNGLVQGDDIRVGKFNIRFHRVFRNGNHYIGFYWNSSDGQQQYEELAVEDLADYPDLIRRVKEEIAHKENQIKRQANLVSMESVGEENLSEDLRKWFKEKWVRFGPDGKIRGSCARGDDSEGKPKCLPQSKAHSLGKKGRKYAAAKKRREDPNPERSGKAINVSTKKKSNEGVSESFSDISGLLAASKLNKSFIITAELAEGGTKKFRVKAQSENVAKEKFMKHYSMAKIIDIKEEGMAEGSNSVYDPITKQQVKKKPIKQQAGGPVTKNGKPVEPGLSKHWSKTTGMAEGSEYTPPKLGTVKANLMIHTQKPTVQVQVFKHNTLRGDSYWVTKEVKVFKTMDQAQAYIDRINNQGVQEDQAPMFTPESKCPHCSGELVSEELMNEKKDACYYKVKSRYKVWPSAYASGALVKCRKKGASNWGTGGKSNESVVEGLVGAVVVHNYTKMPIDLKPGQAQIHGWGPNEQPIYRVKGQDGKEVITSNKKKMMMIAQGQGITEGLTESGNYLYCQNPECGVYLGSLGGNWCPHCGWEANDDKQGVAEGLSKRDQQDVAAIKAAIERLESQLKQPNADKESIQQSIAHERKRLALYVQGVAEGSDSQKTFTVVYYSKKTDRNVTKTIKANNESEVWDKLKSKGIDVVSVKEQGVKEGNDKEFYTGGSKGLPMPGTYEEENNIFKRHGARRITAMTNEEQLDEKWSDKYKRSIDCNNPKGFSQKAHCQGRKNK